MRSLVLVLAAAIHAPAFAQIAGSTLTIRVIAQDSAPIAGAVVRSGGATARTNAAGTAELRLPPGTHELHATRIGFLPGTATVSITGGLPTTVILQLTAQTALLSDVFVVASTRSGRRIEDDPIRVEVLVRDEVEEKLLMTPGDITMMLNETSGLRVQTTSPSLGGATVRIQGLRGRYTQILSDGLPLYGGQAGGLGLLQIPPMDLGGVEIIKGSASALYGGAALGGVINLISRRPQDESVRELMLNQTVFGGSDAVAFIATPGGNGATGMTLLAGGHTQRQVDRDRDGWTDIPGYERLVLRPRLFWSALDGSSLMLTAGFTGEGRRGGTMPGRTAPDNAPFPERLRTRRFDAGGVARLARSERSSVTLRGSATVQQHRHLFGAVLENDQHVTWFTEGAWSVARGISTWVFGAAAQEERYSSSEFPAFDFVHSTPGVFAQATLQPSAAVALTGSVRFDAHSEYGGFLSPRLSLLLRPIGEWSIRASAGSGYFAPTPFTEETEVTGLSVVEELIGLRAERATTASLDIGGTLGVLEVNGTIFGSRLSSPVGVAAAGDDITRVQLVNVAAPTRTVGGELLLRAHPDPFHLTASYTIVHTRESDPGTGERRAASLVPRHQAGLVAALELEERWRAGLEVYYTGRQPLSDDAYRVEGRAQVHVGVLAERRVGRARFYVNAENLLNTRQTRYDPLVRAERGLGGRWTNDVWAPLEGRVANAGVRLEF